MIQLFDTHCHIHDVQNELPGDDAMRAVWVRANMPDPDDMIRRAADNGVTRLICVGTNAANSRLAADFAQQRSNCWASVGLHPHEAKDGETAHVVLRDILARIKDAAKPYTKIVAIGECGLDYFYTHSSKKAQAEALQAQIELALEYDLPLIFHVREAFDDFWPVFDRYQNLRGVLHSYTDTRQNLDKALARGLYIGANGIMTFTKDAAQLATIQAVPLQKLLIETDAPFLTPKPFRGKVNEPAYGSIIARFLADLRSEAVENLAVQTTRNAHTLFNLTQTD